TYRNSQSISTISILHSLIFQLVLENKDLQPILCNVFQSQRRDIKSSSTFARDTLSNLLKCTGVTYIIVDGLDEVDENKRQMFLHELLVIWKDCSEMKVLVSSRREEDIARILRAEAQPIWIGRKNAG